LIPFETLLYDAADGIATLTLNRPDRLNAVNASVIRELVAAFDRADADDSVRAVIVTGAGRAFCAGADLGSGPKTFDGRGERPEDHRDGGGHRVQNRGQQHKGNAEAAVWRALGDLGERPH